MSNMKPLKEKLAAFFASEEVKPLIENGKEYHVVEKDAEMTADPAGDQDDKKTSPDEPTDPPADPEKVAANADGKTVKIKLDLETSDAQKKLTEFRDTAITSEAETFVKAEIEAGRLVPAQKTAVTSLYIQAAKDDFDTPLAQGSRVEFLKAAQKDQRAHAFGKEKVDAEANKVVFAGATEATAMKQAVDAQVDSYVATVNPKAKLEAVKN